MNIATTHDEGAARIRSLLIVDDHPLMCEALAMTLTVGFAPRAVRTARCLAEALARISDEAPDAVILDVNLPDARGIDGILTLRRVLPGAPITLISADPDPGLIADALAAGASGFLDKSLPRDGLRQSLRRIWDGEKVVPDGYAPVPADEDRAALIRRFGALTPQQLRILRLVCMGKANKEISFELSIAEATVKTHLSAVMAKMNVCRRTQVVRLANIAQLFAEG